MEKIKIFYKGKGKREDVIRHAYGKGLMDIQYEGDDIIIDAHSTLLLSTGIHMEMPDNWYASIHARSSSAKKGLIFSGIIDSDYRGEIYLIIHNLNAYPVKIEKGSKLAQIAFHERKRYGIEFVDSLDELTPTDRGDKGFGSSGK